MLQRGRGCRRVHRLLCPRVRPGVPVVDWGVVVLLVRQVHHEALPGRIEIPLAGAFGAGEAVSHRQLERAKGIGVANPGVVLGREVVHEEVDVVGDRARRLGVGFARRRHDEAANRPKMMTQQILTPGEASADRKDAGGSVTHPEREG